MGKYVSVSATTSASTLSPAFSDAQKAFQTFRPVLRYPGLVEQPDEFSETLQAFAEISMQIGEAQFASRLRTAARTPTDVKQLFGWCLPLCIHECRHVE
jgi:hypothetical protein